jgi:hypothetical protein
MICIRLLLGFTLLPCNAFKDIYSIDLISLCSLTLDDLLMTLVHKRIILMYYFHVTHKINKYIEHLRIPSDIGYTSEVKKFSLYHVLWTTHLKQQISTSGINTF